jgi:phage-related protein
MPADGRIVIDTKIEKQNVDQELRQLKREISTMTKELQLANMQGMMPFQKQLLETRKKMYGLAMSMHEFSGTNAEFMAQVQQLGKEYKKANDALLNANNLAKVSLIQTAGQMMNMTTQAKRISENYDRMGNALYKVNQAGLAVADRMNQIANNGNAAVLALRMLGPTASMKDLLNMQRMITQGLMRFQMVALAATVSSAMLYGGLHEAAKKANAEYAKSFEEMMAALRQAFQPMVEVFAEVMTHVYKFVTVIANMIIKFNEAHPVLAKMIQGFLMLIPALTLILSPLAIGIGLFNGMLAAWNSIWMLIGPLVTGLAAMSATVWVVAGAIVGLVTVGVLLYKNWDQVKAFLLQTWETIKSAALAIWEGIKAGLAAAWEGIKTVAMTVWEGIKAYFTTMLSIYVTIFSAVWEGVKTVLTTIWEAIKTIATTVWEGIKTFFSTVLEGIKTAFSTVWEAIKTALSTVWETIKTTATTVWEGIKTFFSTVLDGIKTTFSTVWDTIKGALETVWNTLKSTAETVWNGVKTFFETTLNTIKNTFTTVWNTARDTVIGVWNTLKTKAQEIFNTLATFFSNTWNNVKNTAVNIWNTIKSSISNIASNLSSAVQSTFNTLKSAISNIFNDVKSTLINIWEGIKSKAKSWASGFVEVGKDLLRGIWEGIRNLDDWLWSKVKGMLSGLTDKIKDFFDISSPSGLMEKYGNFVTEGFAIGITADAKLAEDIILDIAKRIANAGKNMGAWLSGALETSIMPKLSPNIAIGANRAAVGNGAGSVTVVVQNMNVRSEQDIYKISRELNRIIDRSSVSRGIRR